MDNSLALYVHWPFCRAKCPYCDFNSHVREEVEQARWRAALLAELQRMAERSAPGPVSSVFFGGGTPSLMPPDTVAAVLDEAQRRFGFTETVEITLEANPTSAEAGKFREFRNAGVNRVSLGVQSLEDEALAFLGREHTAREALDAVSLARETFARVSFDLIYARPGQTVAAWEAELRQALPYAEGHLSLYQLTIEPGTAFHHAYHRRRAFRLPEDDMAAVLFARTQDIMEEAGLPAYEISNHAAPGEASRHNLTYWQGGAYLGIGPGAHGRIQDTAGVWYATTGIRAPEVWLEHVEHHGHGMAEEEVISTDVRKEELVLTGLRLREGMDRARFRRQTGCDVLTVLNREALWTYTASGHVRCTAETVALTPDKGWPLLDYLLAELLPPE